MITVRPSMIGALALGASLAAGAARAEEGFSRYTALDLDACQILAQDREHGGVALRCSGDNGVPLYVSEGDLRFTVAVGEPEGGFVTPAPFNWLGDTVEWRYGRGERGLRAVIIRYYLSNPEGDGVGSTELAVIAAPTAERPSCYLAFIKPDEKPSQNEAAREVADMADEYLCLQQWSG